MRQQGCYLGLPREPQIDRHDPTRCSSHTRENPQENKQGGAHNCLRSHASWRIVLLYCGITSTDQWLWGVLSIHEGFLFFDILFFNLQESYHVNWSSDSIICHQKGITLMKISKFILTPLPIEKGSTIFLPDILRGLQIEFFLIQDPLY